MAFSAIIVGNGPSLWGAHRGHFIDSHDYVIRLGAFRKAYNIWDYGKKTDAVCIPNTLVWRLIKHSYIHNVEVWIAWKEGPQFSTIGVSGSDYNTRADLYVPKGPDSILRLDTGPFNKIVYFSVLLHFYKDMFKKYYPDGYFFSKGCTAALIVMDYLMLNKLVLIGCDNLKSGSNSSFKSHRYNFGTGQVEYSEVDSNHSYELEHVLIDKVKDNYPVEVVYV